MELVYELLRSGVEVSFCTRGKRKGKTPCATLHVQTLSPLSPFEVRHGGVLRAKFTAHDWEGLAGGAVALGLWEKGMPEDVGEDACSGD